MLKKYLSFVFLIAAAGLLFYVKNHQRGKTSPTTHTEPHVTIPSTITANNNNDLPFNRHSGHLIYTKHAKCRMECRHIDETEVQEILDNGTLNNNKIEESDKGKSYPLEGVTHDKQHVRIVFAPKQENLVVVTVIDLDKDWYCDCK
ncbi:DUF4258 domain-containing protein [Ferruginibacter sp. SUN106]|uniref:DUF4258 domain-containing protein n=1 Tax=Ferruginibacter sp. SUN106 TaxID=2978348 RepID=UPI003D3642B4